MKRVAGARRAQVPGTDGLATTPQFDKLVALLKELFQLDRPDLDFGIYRVMHAKSAEITKFLERDLLPQVRQVLFRYESATNASTQQELADALRSAEALGVNPDDSTTVKDLRAKLESVADVQTLESEIYDHLYGFFRRYYSDGDFISKRVYKPGVYAIPYEGEEVKLHWATADQYYIKTSEYLRDYAFRLRPGDSDPMRVCFRLVEAMEGEHGNVKEAATKKRVFLLRDHDFISEESSEHGKELILRFEYRPATLADWPEDQRSRKRRPPSQKDLLAQAEDRLPRLGNPQLSRWIQALARPHVAPDGSEAEYSRFRLHLNRYTARHTFDYFIHKDLDGFLRRELDFYIKNEVMHLDDVEHGGTSGVARLLSKIRVTRRIGMTIIGFLSQLEDFQKALWLKKKFVVETSYCVRMGCIPSEFHDEIVANEAQMEEWRDLIDVGTADGDPVLPVLDRIRLLPSLVLDTQYFGRDFTDRLVEALSLHESLDEQCDGLLVHGENLQALTLLQARYCTRVGCIYIDPPYNTGNDGFLYKDDYRHSSWLSLMQDRLAAGRALVKESGAIVCSIDEVEQPSLRRLLDDTWGGQNLVADMVWAAGRKNDSRLVSVSHEYMVVYAASRQHLTDMRVQWRHRKKGLDAIYAQYRRLKKRHGKDYDAMTTNMKKWFAALPNSDPAKDHRHYSCVDSRGLYFPDNISWPGGGGPRYEVLHPTTCKPVTVPRPGWRLTQEKMGQYLRDDRIHFGSDEQAVPCIKSYLQDREYQAPYSVFYQDGRAATQRLRNILGTTSIGYPKDEVVIAECVNMVAGRGGLVLDYFAGSGTTGHAVVNLNRQDGGNRKFILVEMGDHFDAVLLARLKKIAFTADWKEGKPKRAATAVEIQRSPRIIKIIRLESYEDTINNVVGVDSRRTDVQQATLEVFSRRGFEANGDGKQYLLGYMLDVEAQGNPSFLNVAAFVDPTSYRLKAKQLGMDESREVNVDLLETYNWLIGCTVHRITAPRTYEVETERDGEGRLRLVGALKEQAGGPWWFRTVAGTLPDGRRVLVIWRKRPGGDSPEGIERDNLVLGEWFRMEGLSAKEGTYDLIYVNGSNNLENLKSPSDTWTVRLIEDDFHRLMWEQ